MNLVEKARLELEHCGYNTDPTKTVEGDPFSGMGIAIMKTVETFFEEGWSGMIAPSAAHMVYDLLMGNTLSPLTGKDDEWSCSDFGGEAFYQNTRCYHIFKQNGRAYNSNARVFVEQVVGEDGKPFPLSFSNGYSSEYIEFPYTPTDPERIEVPKDYDFDQDPLNLIKGEMATERKLKAQLRKLFDASVKEQNPELHALMDSNKVDWKVVNVEEGDDPTVLNIDIETTSFLASVSSAVADAIVAHNKRAVLGIEGFDKDMAQSVISDLHGSKVEIVSASDTHALDMADLQEQGILSNVRTGFEVICDGTNNPRYEQDDGALSDEQVAEIRRLSTATDIQDSDFDQKLF